MAIDTFFFSLYHLLYLNSQNHIILFPFLQSILKIFVIIANYLLLEKQLRLKVNLLTFQKISSKVEAKIAEIATERNISQNLTKEITAKVLEIIQHQQKEFEGETIELEGYVHCLEANFNRLERIMNAQVEKYGKLLKERIELQRRIDALEGK